MSPDDRLSRSRRQEKEGMKRFGGVCNPRSGARWDRKNDGRTSDELVEFKRTDNQRSITLLYDDLHELRQHALVESRRPVLCFELAGEHFVVLPEREYHELADGRRESGLTAGLRAPTAHLVQPGKVSRRVLQRDDEPLLRRPPAQRPGAGSQGRLSRNPSGPPRPLPGARPMSRLRPPKRGEVGRLGRMFRKRATEDQAGTSP